jgi:AcrR family transcriptional regulator
MVSDENLSERQGGPGRPRSEAARLAILEAAYDLVVARGYAAVTTADIAAAAGAGKQTIYRWWASKAVLVLDALQHRGEVEIDPEQPSDQSLEGFFRRVCEGTTRAGPALRSLMAEAQFDGALRAELKARLIDRRRAALRQALARWRINEERHDALILALYGALWYRLLLDEPLDEVFITEMMALAEISEAR